MERKRRSSTRTASQQEPGAPEEGTEAVKRERMSGSAIQYHDVTAASFRIRNGVKETPLKVRHSHGHKTCVKQHIHSQLLLYYRNLNRCRRCWGWTFSSRKSLRYLREGGPAHPHHTSYSRVSIVFLCSFKERGARNTLELLSEVWRALFTLFLP